MKFRLTIGEDGSSWGKQVVLFEGKAENAIEFVKKAIKTFAPDARYTKQYQTIKNAWVDAGEGTIPIAVMNLKF